MHPHFATLHFGTRDKGPGKQGKREAIEESAKVMIRGENKEARQQTKKQEKIKKEARPVRG